MKILQLKFKNINSLFGEWDIDFTQPKFTDNGIFAITGKTGSGKSSILDAIALALFGKTPRVVVTGENNDVMTRGTNDCYSEIIFEVNGEKWKSTWKQERTRTGNFKPVNRTVADAADTIVAEKVRDCEDKINEILGLTFEQFTKVVMLAQGSFAAFLQADKKDKAQLLEQITGTEIYGEISKKVFERHKSEKEKLEKILVELGAIKILSEEEIEKLETENAELEKYKIFIDNDLQQVESAKKWLADLQNLQKQIDEAKAKIPDLQAKVEKAKTDFEQSEENLTKAKDEKEKIDKILVKVRELDTKISEKNKLLQPVSQSINELNKTKKELEETLKNQENELDKSKKNLTEKQNWATENAKYKNLAGQYTAIENQDAQAKILLNDFHSKQKDFENIKADLTNKILDFQKSQTIFTEKENVLKLKKQELESKKNALLEILKEKELSDYQREKENITTYGTKINNLIEIETSIIKNHSEIDKCDETISVCENSEKEISDKIFAEKKTLENLENRINLLDENIKLAKTVQSLETHRRMLEDGKECPLCGSKEHPYAVGNVPQIGEKETELKKAKEQKNINSEQIREYEKSLVQTISDKNNALRNREKERKLLSENTEKQKTVLSEIKVLHIDFYIPENENRVDFLKKNHSQKQLEYRQINAIILRANEVEKSLKDIQEKEIPTLQQAKETAEKEKNRAETARKLAEQQVETKQNLQTDAEKNYEEKNVELEKIFAEYDVKNIENLKKYFEQWNENTSFITNLTEQIGKLEKEFALTDSDTKNNQENLKIKIFEQQNIEYEKQKLITERTEIFGEKQVEIEEKRLKNLLENAEKQKTEADKIKTNFTIEITKNQGIIAEKEKDLTQKQEQKITDKSLEELQTEFDEKKPQSDSISQKIGANRRSLNDNEQRLKDSGEKMKDKNMQQQICHKWGKINELIGSQEGTKYRSFAQALTFEHLIGLANRQLQKMSERYILKRVGDAANPFELSVIDKFQNCEERTAQNLSGGEKFIASLSLALGLANMASKNMKIDTMFIDEGFGTLDSDYLEVALSALSNLQNEGKLIGVISHLTELKERIVTHIEVIPTGNGHSKIELIN